MSASLVNVGLWLGWGIGNYFIFKAVKYYVDNAYEHGAEEVDR